MKENGERAYIAVDLAAIRSNVARMSAHLGEKTGIYAVIKCDGYGHGAVPIGKALEDMACVRGFAVATAGEALTLRENGIRKPILIIGYCFKEDYEPLINAQIELTVFDEESINTLEQCARQLEQRVRIHIMVDTGMNRLGLRPDDAGMELVKKAAAAKHLQLEGIFTHFARADETDKTAAREQWHHFKRFVRQVEDQLPHRIPVKHCANSAGVIGLPETGWDAVRIGIALYGIGPSAVVGREALSLLPALSFRSRIVMLKEVPAGMPVSYGGTFRTVKKTMIATVPVGYGDGYPHGMSNRGYVLVRGQEAPILGRICMDYFMADVTGIAGAAEGDAVTLVGKDAKRQITIEDISALTGRFHYELVCDLGQRIPRTYNRYPDSIGGGSDAGHD